MLLPMLQPDAMCQVGPCQESATGQPETRACSVQAEGDEWAMQLKADEPQAPCRTQLLNWPPDKKAAVARGRNAPGGPHGALVAAEGPGAKLLSAF